MALHNYDNKRATRAIILLEHILHNLDCVRNIIGLNKKICAVVKADAYGHGAVEVSRKALEWGVDFLAVATVPEAIILRNAGIKAPIILFTIALDDEINQVVDFQLTPFVIDRTYADKIQREAFSKNIQISVHLKVDTGMGRVGVIPERAPELATHISRLSHIELGGVCTHLSVSDSPEKADMLFTESQINIFSEVVKAIKARGIDPGICHAANSGGIIAHRKSHFDMVRPGICLYGYYPDRRMDKSVADFKPLMELVSKISFIKKVPKGTGISYGRMWSAPKETYIATVPAGYADGYNRRLSSKGQVLIKGKLFPVVGRVCMDQFMVDLGPDSNIDLFEDLVLFGPNQGALDAADIAELTGTIPYEVTCNINKRVPRDYKNPTPL